MACSAVLLLLLVPLHTNAQFPGTHSQMMELSKWFRWKDAGSAIKQHVTNEALQALERRRTELAKLKGEADWLERRDTVRTLIGEVLGRGMPTNRTPLNVKYTKTTKHSGTNATVEMLYFESRPGFYVTAGLWRPADDAPGKDPKTGERAALLYASGHSCQGWRR